LCLASTLWNGRDPILKERAFGLTGAEANHGHDPEYELLDTGMFDGDRYWVVDMHYAKADATDVLMTINVTNAGPDAEALHVLPSLWFRNTWSWEAGATRPTLAAGAAGTVAVAHPVLGSLELLAGPAPHGEQPELLFCDNDTNLRRLYGASTGPRWPKDGINDHVVGGTDTVNPQRRGTKYAHWYRVSLNAGETAEIRVRLRPAATGPPEADALGTDFTRVNAQRRAEADEFYAVLSPPQASADEAAVMRQAFAGMLWNKQFYYYYYYYYDDDVAKWLDGDSAQPLHPTQRKLGPQRPGGGRSGPSM
jgi:hypothetical protein